MIAQIILLYFFFSITCFAISSSSENSENFKINLDSGNNKTIPYSLSEEEIESSRNAIHLPFGTPLKIPDKYSNSLQTQSDSIFILVDKFKFEIGETIDQFLKDNPEFKVGETVNESIHYYYDFINSDASISVLFRNDNLDEVYINDEFWSGLLTDFEPTDFGFIKIRDEYEYFNNLYPNALIEIYQKENVLLEFRGSRFGFLKMSKLVK